MLQLTARRAAGITLANSVIVANIAHVDVIGQQLNVIDIVAQALILDPVARSTAPAVALAALAIEPDACMLGSAHRTDLDIR